MAKLSNKKIDHPMTVIGVFASIAEIAMVVVLLRLDRNLQNVFIWFTMIFPFFLVSLFFLILYKKPAALFSPSDYQKDSSYLASISDEKKSKKLGNQLDNISEYIQTVKTYTEKILQDQEFNLGNIVDEENERLAQSLFWRELLQNSFVSHLVNDFELSEEQITKILGSDNDANSIIDAVYDITNDSNKKERLERLMQQFPKTIVDFERAKALFKQ